jgi:hypothetical protein
VARDKAALGGARGWCPTGQRKGRHGQLWPDRDGEQSDRLGFEQCQGMRAWRILAMGLVGWVWRWAVLYSGLGPLSLFLYSEYFSN